MRVGRIAGELVLNPTWPQMQEPDCDLDMVVAGTAESILMIEAGGTEVTEDVAMDAVRFAQEPIRQLCQLQDELREAVGKPKWAFEEPEFDKELLLEDRVDVPRRPGRGQPPHRQAGALRPHRADPRRRQDRADQ